MDCRMMDRSMKDHSRAKGESIPIAMYDLRRHCAVCPRCRERYGDVLDAEPHHSTIPNHSREKHRRVAVGEASVEKFPDIAKPAEFKDAPLTFSLHFNGKEQKIKIVEPKIDVPLPHGSRLVVSEKEACLCDVVFKLNPQSSRPYELHFNVMMGVTYNRDHLVVFGTGLEEDKDLQSVYRHTIVDRGGVKADIEMTGGKARLFIVYKPLQP